VEQILGWGAVARMRALAKFLTIPEGMLRVAASATLLLLFVFPDAAVSQSAEHPAVPPAAGSPVGPQPAETLLGSQQSPPASSTQEPALVIEQIEIRGNRRIPRATIQARLFSRAGDPYNEDALRRDFRALWNTQFFEDIRLEVEPSPNNPNGRIVIFYLQERPIIRRIEYQGLKSVTESDVLERFKERKVGLSVESPFDPTRIKRAEVVLRELLGERGRQFATVKPTYERIQATNAVRLIFNIDEGPKVKVGRIEIEGNTVFSDRKIIRAMRHSRPVAIPMWLFDLNLWSKTYDRRKLNEDLEIGIRSLYQDHGYFRVLVKEPRIETADINRPGLPGPWPLIGRKRGKRTNITIGIEEGDLFRMGELFIRSSNPDQPLRFRVDVLRNAFPLKKGDVFSVEKVRKALKDYQQLYSTFGFIDFTTEPLFDIDAENKLINLTLQFDEQKQFFVRRIEFQGNTTTRDKVIRREILLDEGDMFDSRKWEISILRLNQLDYFEPIKAEEHVEMKRNQKEGTLDLLLKVKEKGKQSIGLTGGVSGIAGSFVGISYQTNNFLGLGETLSFAADFGDRQRNFLFGFTEPYLFDRPISVGFTIFSSRFSFDQARETALLIGRPIQLDPNLTQNFDQNRSGFTVFASYPLRRFAFSRVGLTYSYSTSDITPFSQASRLIFENLQFRGFAGPSALRGIRSSRLVPTFAYNTIDHPINPTRGTSLFLSTSVEGGLLGGNVKALTQLVEFKHFRPARPARNTFGFRLLTAFATGFGGQVLPPFNRFFLGGEDSVRGFDIFNITPLAFIPVQTETQLFFFDPTQLDGSGNPRLRFLNVPLLDFSTTFPGGDAQVVANVEYRIPLVGPLSLSLFFDAGLNGILRRDQLTLTPEGLARLRSQFPNTNLSERLALAPGSNFRLRTSTGIELVIQLPVVNAPFRFYWAYNLNRYRRVIFEPRGDFFLSEELRNSLPPGVLDSQILPQLNNLLGIGATRINFFEPLRTFRFTVSRTF